jgi:hypothetical protein
MPRTARSRGCAGRPPGRHRVRRPLHRTARFGSLRECFFAAGSASCGLATGRRFPGAGRAGLSTRRLAAARGLACCCLARPSSTRAGLCALPTPGSCGLLTSGLALWCLCASGSALSAAASGHCPSARPSLALRRGHLLPLVLRGFLLGHQRLSSKQAPCRHNAGLR